MRGIYLIRTAESMEFESGSLGAPLRPLVEAGRNQTPAIGKFLGELLKGLPGEYPIKASTVRRTTQTGLLSLGHSGLPTFLVRSRDLSSLDTEVVIHRLLTPSSQSSQEKQLDTHLPVVAFTHRDVIGALCRPFQSKGWVESDRDIPAGSVTTFRYDAGILDFVSMGQSSEQALMQLQTSQVASPRNHRSLVIL